MTILDVSYNSGERREMYKYTGKSDFVIASIDSFALLKKYMQYIVKLESVTFLSNGQKLSEYDGASKDVVEFTDDEWKILNAIAKEIPNKLS